MSEPLKFVNHKIEEYALKVTYNPVENAGNVIYNLTYIKKDDLETAVSMFKDAYATGLCVSDRVIFTDDPELAGAKIPDGCCCICTLCSLILDSLLYKKGINVNSIGGGLVEVEELTPRRFTALVRYESTTIDPITVMISQNGTSVKGVIDSGDGTILANVRECNMEAESALFEVIDDLNAAGFTGILDVGVPNASLLGVPITPNYQGIAMVGGTNPIAAFKEMGLWAEVQSMKGLMDISKFNLIGDY